MSSCTDAQMNVDVYVHDVSSIDKWDELSIDEKLELLRDLTPEQSDHVHNTAVAGLLQYIVDNLDIDQSTNENASHLAIGTDDTTPTVNDSALGNEVHRNAVTSTTDGGSSLQITTLFDTGEANGNTLVEVALFTASSGGTMLNRAIISDVEKTDQKTLTVDVTLTFSAA